MKPKKVFLFFFVCLFSNIQKTYSQRLDSCKYVRLLFVANCFDSSENSSFKFAALNLKKEYDYDSFENQIIKFIFFDNARLIIDSINGQSSLIKSIDFFSHSQKDRIGSQKILQGISYRTSLFISKKVMDSVKKNDKSMVFGKSAGHIGEINFKKFSYDASVEIHGCKSGKDADSVPINICVQFSNQLTKAGKLLGVVIGHGTRANPQINGLGTKLIEQDYRHGLRFVYFNGKPILKTLEKGRLERQIIISSIVQFSNSKAIVEQNRNF